MPTQLSSLSEKPAPAALPGAEKKFAFKETRLAGQLEISRDRIRELRQQFLTENVHWALLNKRVMLSSEGASLIRANNDTSIPKKNAPPSPASNAAPVKAPVKLIVWAIPKVNPRLIVAYHPGTDPANPLNLVSVRVASNVFFMSGDELQAAQVKHDEFNLIGPCPRVRGEWRRKKR